MAIVLSLACASSFSLDAQNPSPTPVPIASKQSSFGAIARASTPGSTDPCGDANYCGADGDIVPGGWYNPGYTSHLPFGPVSSISHYTSPEDIFYYDLDFRMIQNGSSAAVALGFAYDPDNNVTGVTSYENAANNQTLTYDVLDRLERAVGGTGGYGSYSYTYDKLGNRLTQVANGTTTDYAYAPETQSTEVDRLGRSNDECEWQHHGFFTGAGIGHGFNLQQRGQAECSQRRCHDAGYI